jgi:glycosyltransferase involved in cell wall biosynthesis
MDKPLVSIIIPVYNTEKYLAQCIESAINQTYQNLEIIIIDDGSTDNSLKIAKTFNDNRINIFSQNNKGASAARNLGILKSNGEFLQFLDADDFISLNKIESQIELALKNISHLIGCTTIHFFEHAKLNFDCLENLDDKIIFSKTNPIDFLINLWGVNDGKIYMVQPNAWLCPKQILLKTGNWNENLTLDDDGEFFCRIILNSKGIIFDNKSKNFYRKYLNSKSISGGMNAVALKSQLNSLRLKKEHLFKFEETAKTKTAIANLYLVLCFISFKKNKQIYKIAKDELKKLNTKSTLKLNLGGRIVNILALLIGWKNARSLSLLKNRFKKNENTSNS